MYICRIASINDAYEDSVSRPHTTVFEGFISHKNLLDGTYLEYTRRHDTEQQRPTNAMHREAIQKRGSHPELDVTTCCVVMRCKFCS